MSAAGSQSNEKLPDEVPYLVAIMQELSLLKERVAFLEQSAPQTPDNIKTSVKRFCKNIAQLGSWAARVLIFVLTVEDNGYTV